MTPDAEIPEVNSFTSLIERARVKTSQKIPRAALLAPQGEAAVRGFFRAAAEHLIDPIVIGDPDHAEPVAVDFNLDFSTVQLKQAPGADRAFEAALAMVHAGEIDLLVFGFAPSSEFISGLSARDANFVPGGGLLSHLGVIKPGAYHKLLMVTDGMVHEEPDLKTKLGIAGNLGKAAATLGIPNPRTAVVTAVEAIYPQMPATLDGAVMAKMYSRGQIKGVRIDGPLSFDIAVDSEAATAKGITDSVVAGQADAMLASTSHVASGIYQALSLFGRCELGGVIVGGRVPVVASYRTDSETTCYHSIVLAVLLA
jgi:phosphate butyryltransferase